MTRSSRLGSTRWLPCVAAALAWQAAAAQPNVVSTEHVRAELLAHSPEGIAPGKPVWLGLAIAHQPHWHTYWKNPGDSGLPTVLSWQLNDGATAGDIAWPTPQALPVGPLMNQGYEGSVLLAVPVTVPSDFRARELRVALQAEWLVCKDVCVPESGEFALTLPARQATAAHAQQFADAQARVPLEARAVQARARIERRSLAVEVDGLPAAMHGRTLRFFAEMTGVVDHAAAIAQRWDAGRWLAQVPLSSQRSESPIQMYAVLVPEGQARGIRVRLTITGSWSTAALAAVSAARRVVMLAPHNAREPSSMASTKE